MTPPRNARPHRSWPWLLGSGAALLIGATAHVEPAAATWFGVRGPHCPLGSCLGEHACPGCGLVRGVSSALQGDLAGAWLFHPAAIAIAALLVGSFAVHVDIIRRGHELPFHRRLRRAGHLTFAAAVLLGWALRLAGQGSP